MPESLISRREAESLCMVSRFAAGRTMRRLVVGFVVGGDRVEFAWDEAQHTIHCSCLKVDANDRRREIPTFSPIALHDFA